MVVATGLLGQPQGYFRAYAFVSQQQLDEYRAEVARFVTGNGQVAVPLRGAFSKDVFGFAQWHQQHSIAWPGFGPGQAQSAWAAAVRLLVPGLRGDRATLAAGNCR
ncbi:hypothetical protein B0919_10845 [Hymenobacter sp. CRA2]|nr:hypothetical protein B0919_10845 [Hymenobacter sp. CRA2]